MLVLTPFVALFGLLALVVVVGVSFLPPFYAVVLVLNGSYIWAGLVAVLWLMWLRFGGPVRSAVFEGFEHSGT